MNPNRLLTLPGAICVLALAIATAGCGSSGGGESAPPPTIAAPPPPSTETLAGAGVLTKIAPGMTSVTVNGVDFDTDSTQLIVTADNQVASIDDLSVGHVVSVRARSDDNGGSFEAQSIDREDSLDGPVSVGSVDTAAGTFVVLGQVVRVTATTIFDDSITPPSLDGLTDGDRVEVHGLADAAGILVATRIETDDNPGLLEVTGVVSELDEAAMRFRLGALVVDYRAATLRDFDSGGPRDGRQVEAKGNTLGNAGELIATEVQAKDTGFAADDGDQASVEGFVTRFASASDFDVARRPVTTTAQTEFERGTADDLTLNARLEAEGSLNVNGVLVASKIEFKTGADQSDVRIETIVDDVDAANGRLVLLGLQIGVDSSTMLEDKSDADLAPFNLSDINPGDYVEMRGFEEPIGSGQLVAVKLEREDVDEDTVLQGAVDNVAEPSFTILGITVHTGPGTRFEGQDDQPIAAAAFFAALGDGVLVKAKGSVNGGVIEAREVELED